MARGFYTTFGVGSTDNITLTSTLPTAARSYSIWSYRDGGGHANGRLWQGHTSGGSETELFYQSSISKYNYQRNSSSSAYLWTINLPPSSQWVHALIIDPYDEGLNPKIYIDGTAVTVTKEQGGGTYNSPGSGSYYTLGNRSSGGRYWNGMLAEFAMWDGQLTAQNAVALAAGYSPLLIKRDALVEYVPLRGETASLLLGVNTTTGTAVQPHPPIIYPRGAYVVAKGATAGGAVSLSPNNGAHGSRADVIVFGQNHNIGVSDAIHDHTASQETFSQAHMVAADGALHGHVAANITFSQIHYLNGDNADHNHRADQIGLAAANQVVSNSSVLAHTADSISFAQIHQFSVLDATHNQPTDMARLAVQSGIIIADGLHNHGAENIDLAQVHVLALDPAQHLFTSDQANIGLSSVLATATHTLTPGARSSILQPAASGRTITPEK